MQLTLEESEELRGIVERSGEQEAAESLDVDRRTLARALARLRLKPRLYRRLVAALDAHPAR